MPRKLNAADLPSGPSLLIDGPSQIPLSQLEGLPQQRQPARPRPRVALAPEEIDSYLQMTHQGKITTRNAWDIKLIEGLQDTIAGCLNSNDDDHYAQFTKAAQVVEGGAKVYTHRVDQTYLLSNQMVRRLLRNDTRKDAEGDEDDAAPGEGQPQRKKRRRKPLERTAAESVDEINMDSAKSDDVAGARGALAAHGALFRAVTEKFDQGHAQGLLMSNTPVGLRGNLVLDRDFAREDIATIGQANRARPALVDDGTDTAQAAIDLAAVAGDFASVQAGEVDDGSTVHQAAVQRAEQQQQQQQQDQQRELSRAPSMFAAGEQMLDGADDDDGHMDYDGPDGDLDETLLQPQLSAVGSRLGSAARDIATGRADLDALDAHLGDAFGKGLALEKEIGWVPLSQQATSARGFGRPDVGATLDRLRRQAAPAKDERPARRRRVVSFAETGEGTDPLTFDEKLLEPLPKIDRACTAFGKRVLDPKHRLSVDLTLYTSNSADNHVHARGLENRLTLPEDSAILPEWCDTAMRSTTAAFFQPFAARLPHWNLLKKRSRTVVDHSGYDDCYAQTAAADDNDDMPDFDDHDGPEHDDDAPPPADQLDTVGAGFDGMAALAAADGDVADPLYPAAAGAVPAASAVLRVQHATAPTTVDVVKLRNVMWRRINQVAAPAPAPAEAQRMTSMSDAIGAMLPDVSSIAKDGTLSPAFFFFSLLFLANEHGLDLEQVVEEASDEAPNVVRRVGDDVVIRLAEAA